MSESTDEITTAFNPTTVVGVGAGEGAFSGSVATFVTPSSNWGPTVKRDDRLALPIVVTVARQSAEWITHGGDNTPAPATDR